MKNITGPVIPIPVPFKQDESVDLESLDQYIRFLAEHGIKNVMTTVGTSRYNLLTAEEIIEVNKTVAKAAKEKGINSIVANPPIGSTQTAVMFGQEAEKVGADYYLLYFPERHYGDANTLQFFETVAAAISIPILIHEMPRRNGLGGGTIQYSMDLLDKLLQIENIVGFKEEALDADYSNGIVITFHERAEIIGAGGGMSRYLKRDFDLGSSAFLGGIGNFYPELELEFYQAITGGNRARAEEIVNEIELPFFQTVVPFGWHPSLKTALAHCQLMPQYERSPMITLNDEQTKTIQQAVDKIKIHEKV